MVVPVDDPLRKPPSPLPPLLRQGSAYLWPTAPWSVCLSPLNPSPQAPEPSQLHCAQQSAKHLRFPPGEADALVFAFMGLCRLGVYGVPESWW